MALVMIFWMCTKFLFSFLSGVRCFSVTFLLCELLACWGMLFRSDFEAPFLVCFLDLDPSGIEDTAFYFQDQK